MPPLQVLCLLSRLTSSFQAREGWRSYLLLYALPISLVSLAAVYLVVPSAPQKLGSVGKEAYLSSFKQVFLKKSAAACLIGAMFRQAAIGYASVFSATFFRNQFGLSLASAALFVLGFLALFSLGSILGGQLVNRVGRKRLLVATLVVSSPALVLVAFVPNLWVALAFHYIFFFIFSMSNSTTVSLTLEQAPESRGTMMSMNSIFVTLGLALGAALGGGALVLSGWVGLILAFAALGFIAAGIFFFLTEDPCTM